jgi:hypothetical protein
MQKKAIKGKIKKRIINTNIDSKQVGFQIPQLKLEAELKQISTEQNPQITLQIKQDLQAMHKCHPDLIDLLSSIFSPNEVYICLGISISYFLQCSKTNYYTNQHIKNSSKRLNQLTFKWRHYSSTNY